MKKVLAIAIFSLIAAFLSSTVMAYDHLITDDTAVVTEVGSMQAGAKILYLTAGDWWDKDGETQEMPDDYTTLSIPLLFRYGVIENLEAFAILPFEKWDMGDDGESGIGDLWLGAKYGLMPDGLLTLRGSLDIPLGDDEKGLGYQGGFGIDIGALTQKELDAICLNGQVGICYNVEDSDTKWKPGLGIYLDGEASYALSDVLKAQIGLELIFVGKGEDDGTEDPDSDMNWIELNVGGAYMLNETMGLKGDILYDISGTNALANMGVLIGFCYGF